MLVLIAGPPCAGKSTYVEGKAVRGDLILDSDKLHACLGGLALYDRPDELRPYVWAAFFGC